MVTPGDCKSSVVKALLVQVQPHPPLCVFLIKKDFMNYKPLRNNVLLIEKEKPVETESGIYLGDAKADHNNRAGIVLAIGPEVTEVQVGDEVYPMWSKGTTIKEGDEYMAMMSVENILAVVE